MFINIIGDEVIEFYSLIYLVIKKAPPFWGGALN